MAQRNPQREQFWRDILDQWKHSGQSITAFCKRRQLTRSCFLRWQKIIVDQASGKSSDNTPAFVALRVVAEPMAEVVLPSGLVVRLPLSADATAVTRLLTAVRAAAC